MGRDIDPKSSATEYSLNRVKLYFGCPILKEKLSVLWRNVDVSVVFEIGMRKWRFSMCYNDMKFKLQLSNENIWKIELHQQPGKTEKYLLIQDGNTEYVFSDGIGKISRELAKKVAEKCGLDSMPSTFQIWWGGYKGVVAVDPTSSGLKLSLRESMHKYDSRIEELDVLAYNNVIGKLLREIQGISTKEGSITSFTLELAKKSYDPDMEVDGFMSYVEDVFSKKSNYDCKLGNLMDYYGIKSESEILTENIMKTSKSFTKRRDSDVDAITMAVRSLRKEARSWFNDGLDSGSDDANAKASAWYYVTYHHTYYGKYNEGMDRDHFLSFPWCVYDLLVEIKKGKARMSMPSSRE